MENERLLALAEKYATPLYIFDTDAFARRVGLVREVFGPKAGLCYSMKADPFLLRALPPELDALEVCSPGELAICENAGADLTRIVFSGVNKTLESVERAMDDRVAVFTAESPRECVLVTERYKAKNDYVPINASRGAYQKGALWS